MDINQLIKKYFTRDNIVDMLTQYELYYQISLGLYVYETIQDVEETYKKLDELDLKLDIDRVLANIFEILVSFSKKENTEQTLYYEIRVRALIHALKDFVNNDKELLSVDDYVKEKTDIIIKDELFDENMKLEFESEYSKVYDYYDLYITDELVEELQEKFV